MFINVFQIIRPFLLQMLRREEVSKSCDVYSYGVLVFEIVTQQVPFPDVLPIVAAVMTMEGQVGHSEGTSHYKDWYNSCP